MSSSTFHDLAANGRDALSIAFQELMIEESADALLPVTLCQREPALPVTPSISVASNASSWPICVSGSPEPSSPANKPAPSAMESTSAAATDIALPSLSSLCTGLDSLSLSTPRPEESAIRGAESKTASPSSDNDLPEDQNIGSDCRFSTWEMAAFKVGSPLYTTSFAPRGLFRTNVVDIKYTGTDTQESAANQFASIPSFTTEPYFAPWATETGSTIPFAFAYTYPAQGYATGSERDSPYTTNAESYEQANVDPWTGRTMLTPSYERGLALQNYMFDPAIRAGKRPRSNEYIVESQYSQSTSSRSAKRARKEQLPLWMKWQHRRKTSAATATSHSPVRTSSRRGMNNYQRQFLLENARPELKPRPVMIRWSLASHRRYQLEDI